jgi:hypothetical protein
MAEDVTRQYSRSIWINTQNLISESEKPNGTCCRPPTVNFVVEHMVISKIRLGQVTWPASGRIRSCTQDLIGHSDELNGTSYKPTLVNFVKECTTLLFLIRHFLMVDCVVWRVYNEIWFTCLTGWRRKLRRKVKKQGQVLYSTGFLNGPHWSNWAQIWYDGCPCP